MKKILSCVLLSFLYLSVNHAQSFGLGSHFGNSPNCKNRPNQLAGINEIVRTFDEESNKEKNRCFSFGGSLNYYANQNTTFRLKVLVETIEINNENTRTLPSNSNRTELNQRNIQFAPAIIWEVGSKSIRPRLGIELPITVLGKSNTTNVFNSISSNTNQNITNRSIISLISENEVISGTTYGLGLILGASYRLNKWVALNAEISPRVVYRNYISISENKGEFNRIIETFEGEQLLERNEFISPFNNRLENELKEVGLSPTAFDFALVFNF